MPSVLLIFTSASKNLLGKDTGWWLPEAAEPYYILSPTCTVDFGAPLGPNPPLAQGSVDAYKGEECVRFLNDAIVQEKLANAKKLSDISIKDYDAIFYIGGDGPVIDLPVDMDNIKLASDFYQAGKITAAVCHGPAALLNVVDADGKSIFAGKKFTCLTNLEEAAYAPGAIPFSPEDELIKAGGIFSAGPPSTEHVVVDGNLYTGQNPASSASLAKAVLAGLKK